MVFDDSNNGTNNAKVSGGGCPVQHGQKNKVTPDSNVLGVEVKMNNNSSSSQCPVIHNNNNNMSSSSSKNDTSSRSWLELSNWWKTTKTNDTVSEGTNQTTTTPKMANSLEEAAKHSQTPLPDQVIPLSIHRVISSIPKSKSNDSEEPHHQPKNKEEESNRWVYPSEQQFYNAMRRKGWQGVDEATIPFVVRIHNEVNERGWKEVCRWERDLHNNESPKLVKFLGRPKDLSPKAFFFCRFLRFYKDPFDRHDWYVQSSPSTTDNAPPRRYVIDFYNGSDTTPTTIPGATSQQKQQPSMYLDVRPAIDTPDALWDRLRMTARETFPGIFNALSSSSNMPPNAGTNNAPTAPNNK